MKSKKLLNACKEYLLKISQQDMHDGENEMIPDKYQALKDRINELFAKFRMLKQDNTIYGLVHFDYSDGNYHIDYSDGKITVFDFDNCCYCWYMFDLANLWTHGVGWIQWEEDIDKRKAFMEDYFDEILAGYRSETELSEKCLTNYHCLLIWY